MSHDLGILDITWNSSHLVDHIPIMESNGWVMWNMGICGNSFWHLPALSARGMCSTLWLNLTEDTGWHMPIAQDWWALNISWHDMRHSWSISSCSLWHHIEDSMKIPKHASFILFQCVFHLNFLSNVVQSLGGQNAQRNIHSHVSHVSRMSSSGMASQRRMEPLRLVSSCARIGKWFVKLPTIVLSGSGPAEKNGSTLEQQKVHPKIPRHFSTPNGKRDIRLYYLPSGYLT